MIGYPSIKVFRRGNEEVDYWGDNNEEDITDFIESSVLKKHTEMWIESIISNFRFAHFELLKNCEKMRVNAWELVASYLFCLSNGTRIEKGIKHLISDQI